MTLAESDIRIGDAKCFQRRIVDAQPPLDRYRTSKHQDTPKDHVSYGESTSNAKRTKAHAISVRYCSKCKQQHTFIVPCGNRVCDICRKNDKAKAFYKYRDLIDYIQPGALQLVTLTWKPYHNLGNTVDDIRAAFNKLQRRKLYKSAWHGGIYAIECKTCVVGWLVHMHLLIEGEGVSKAQLRKDWFGLSGAYEVDVQECDDPEKTLRYVVKGAFDGPQDLAAQLKFSGILEHKRLIGSFGSWYGCLKDAKKPFCCPHCGEDGDWLATSCQRERPPQPSNPLEISFSPQPPIYIPQRYIPPGRVFGIKNKGDPDKPINREGGGAGI